MVIAAVVAEDFPISKALTFDHFSFHLVSFSRAPGLGPGALSRLARPSVYLTAFLLNISIAVPVTAMMARYSPILLSSEVLGPSGVTGFS